MAKIDFESIVQQMTEQWVSLKEDLYNGVVEYDDLNKLINNYIFFQVFDDIFKETVKFYEVNLSDIKHMYRGVSGYIELENYERMIPKIKFAKGNNRMNPPGKAFLYAGVPDDNIGTDRNVIKKHVVKTVLKEIRAIENSIVTICEFGINDSSKNSEIINICGDSSIPNTETGLNEYINKHAVNGISVDYEKLSYILANVYFNVFSSDQIFKPINTNDQEVKKYEYAPFHALANYIIKQGYAGMIFRSTVHHNGTNLVLFNPNDASVIHRSMEHINTSDYISHNAHTDRYKQ